MAAADPRDHHPLLLSTLCDRGVRMQPDNLIITKTGAGYNTITYLEHQARAKRLASSLSNWGVKVGDCVATLNWNTAWHLQCYHAISCMGAILHTLNLRLGPADLGYIIRHATDRVIIADENLLETLGKVDTAVLGAVELFICCGEDGVPGKWKLPPTIPAAKARDFDAFLRAGSEAFAWPDLPETALHALCYTSGTTGNPKGAAYSHRSTYLHTLASGGADQLGLRGCDVVLPFVPMFHVLSWGVPFMTLMLGARTVLNGRFMDPDTVLDCFIDWGVHVSTGVPTVWQGVRAAAEKRGLAKVAEGLRLRLLTCGGSSPPPEMMAWFLDKLNVEFLQGWGMTETNPLGSLGRRMAKYKDISRSPDELFQNITKAGLPLPGVEVRIADSADLDKDMPAGQPGELLVRGPWIIQAYFRIDAADKFHNGWLITGDVAKIDEEGAIVISDRSKDVIKSGGEWISSIDLENHIASMPGIVMAAVVAVPHPRWDERPLAAVVLEPGTSQDGLLERVHEHCLKKFAKFQLPDDVLVWPSLPLTSTGKLDKKVIREKLKTERYTLPSAAGPASKL
uniref:AMP-dependent synthetase/ligase domain-containing protein n=1 Tax=Alexandrium catenella TaxID=2925 RepID=A0A7S1W5N2_ALECA